jgi:hypothetical protein
MGRLTVRLQMPPMTGMLMSVMIRLGLSPAFNLSIAT